MKTCLSTSRIKASLTAKMFLTLILYAGPAILTAQGLAVNTTGATADSSALLDVASTTQGMLVPRMSATQRGLIGKPATGLLVYQNDGVTGFYFYNGTAWVSLNSSSGAAGGDLAGTYPNPSVANGAITSAKILDGTITNADINTSAAIAYSKLNLAGSVARTDLSATGTASSSTFLRGDNTWATPTASPSGAAGGDLTGTFPNPTVANSAVTSAKILDGTVTNADISSSAAISYSKLNLAGSINNSDLANSSVSVSKISTTGGTASSTTYLRGDGAWATPSGGGASLELMVSMGSTQSITASTIADVQFNSLNTSPTLGFFNTATYSYTVGASGNYLIQLNLLSTAGQPYPMLYVNGALAEYGVQATVASLVNYISRGTLSVIRYLSAGDVIKAAVQNTHVSAAVSLASSSPTRLSIIKL